jgi:amidase
MADDLAFTDATDQAELVRSGQVSPRELVDAAIARIEAVDPEVNAVIHPRFEQARAEADGELPDGPFRGVPLVLKDLDGFSAGDPYHAGNRLLKQVGHVAGDDTELIRRFRQAGFVVVGKGNTPEFGLVPTTEPEAYGPTRNPWDTTRSTGGSSGGPAAAVATGMVPVGHAGDGGGSIRIPASECGLVGLKPSRGRITLGPEVGESWGGLVARLAVTRTVRDTAAVLDAVHGPGVGDSYQALPPQRPYLDEVGAAAGSLRIGWRTDAPEGSSFETHPEVAAAVQAVADRLAQLGHQVSEGSPPALDDAEAVVIPFISVLGVWVLNDLDMVERIAGRPVTQDDVEVGTWAAAELGRSVTGLGFHQAREALHAHARRMVSWWGGGGTAAADGYDLLLCPTIPEPPPTLGQMKGTDADPLAGMLRAGEVVAFVQPFNVTGQPAISLPLGWSSDGLPLGVQLVAAPGREDVLLRVAAQLEEAMPWRDRIPPIHA